VARPRRQPREGRPPASFQAIWRLVKKVAERAGLPVDEIGPHTLRHAFCDHVARHAGLQVAQAAMGHTNLSTTEIYLSAPSLDELATQMRAVTLTSTRTDFAGGASTATGKHKLVLKPESAARPLKAPTGIEPVAGLSRLLERTNPKYLRHLRSTSDVLCGTPRQLPGIRALAQARGHQPISRGALDD
jgi:hypothetical protein